MVLRGALLLALLHSFADSPKPLALPVPVEARAESEALPSQVPTEEPAVLLALRTAELAIEDAKRAVQAKNTAAALKLAEEARRILLPLIRQVDQSNLQVWLAVGSTAVMLQDPALAAAALEAIQRIEPGFAHDRHLLDLLASLNRLPVAAYAAALARDRVTYMQHLGRGAMPELPYQNSLGMQLVPVPGTDVLFSIYETRVRDYEAYAQANPAVSQVWMNPVFGGVAVTPGPDHPVVNVSWDDAKAFCEWLTRKEQMEERLGRQQFYRLPTDQEWSASVGLGPEAGDTPEVRASGIPDVYPWGTGWPPLVGSGNYADLSAKASFPSWEVIDTYRDGYATTAPVGSFSPNVYGIYDLGGNVWEWCESRYHMETDARVVRGASWFNAQPGDLLSSALDFHVPGYRYDCYGFRVVLVTGPVH
jgi:formylglycine-generating enzyme required for sulfatase activity